MKKFLPILIFVVMLITLVVCGAGCGAGTETSESGNGTTSGTESKNSTTSQNGDSSTPIVYPEGVNEEGFMYEEYDKAVREFAKTTSTLDAYLNLWDSWFLKKGVTVNYAANATLDKIYEDLSESYLKLMSAIEETCGDQTYLGLQTIKELAGKIHALVKDRSDETAARILLLGLQVKDTPLGKEMQEAVSSFHSELNNYPCELYIMTASEIPDIWTSDPEMIKSVAFDLPGRPLSSFYYDPNATSEDTGAHESQQEPTESKEESKADETPSKPEQTTSQPEKTDKVDTSGIQGTYSSGFLFLDGKEYSSVSAKVSGNVLEISNSGKVVIRATITGMHALGNWGYHYDIEIEGGAKGMILYDYAKAEGQIQYFKYDSNGEQDVDNSGVFF